MLIAFTYIIAVNLNLLSQILGVHIVSLKNKGYHCRMSQTYHIYVATSENILPLQYINIQTLQNMRAYVRELIWLLLYYVSTGLRTRHFAFVLRILY